MKREIIIIIDILGTILLTYLLNCIYKNLKRKKFNKKIINEKIKLDKENGKKRKRI